MRRVKQTAFGYVQTARAIWVRIAQREFMLALALGLVLCVGTVGTATADTSSSAHYSGSETQFGTGTVEQQCATNYCAKSSSGDPTVGNSSSANYGVATGSDTPGDP